VSETGGVDPDAAFAGFDFSSLGAGGAQDAIESHAFAGFSPGGVHPAHDLHADMAPDALNLLEDVFVFDLNPGHDWQGAYGRLSRGETRCLVDNDPCGLQRRRARQSGKPSG
jgi:hypothetical protein